MYYEIATLVLLLTVRVILWVTSLLGKIAYRHFFHIWSSFSVLGLISYVPFLTPHSSSSFLPSKQFSLSIFSIQNIPDQFWINILKYTLRISQFLWNGIDTFIQLLFIRLEVNFDSKWTFPFITSGSQLQFFWDYLLRNHISKN